MALSSGQSAIASEGTLLSKEEPDTQKYAELEVRSLTGTGAH
ncbi:hypothetical protein ABZ372_15905 [Streptomyces sp. NPDC005921]